VWKIKETTFFSYAEEAQIISVFFTDKLMILLVYKKAYFYTTNFDYAIPSVVVSLLLEFDDVFPENTPSGLPPLRSIEHQIDPVPRPSVPNHPAYRNNPEKTKELQMLIDELMMKGYIRKNMSLVLCQCYLCLKRMQFEGYVLTVAPSTT
jgi:hypothetical protein